MIQPRFVQADKLDPLGSSDHAMLYLQRQVMILASSLGPDAALQAMMNAMTNCAFKFGESAEGYRANLLRMAEQADGAWQALNLAYTDEAGEG